MRRQVHDPPERARIAQRLFQRDDSAFVEIGGRISSDRDRDERQRRREQRAEHAHHGDTTARGASSDFGARDLPKVSRVSRAPRSSNRV
jgi:hypothetical protein